MTDETDLTDPSTDPEDELAAFEEGLERLREEIPYPQFNPSCVPVQVDENTIHIRGGLWNGPILTITDHDDEGVLTALVDLIDGETPVEDILASFSGEHQREVVDALVALRKNDAIHDAASYEEDAFYNHTAMRPFGQEQSDEHRGLGGKSANVLLATDGALGTAIARDLVEVGVDHVTIASLADEATLDVPTGVEQRRSDDIELAIEEADFVVVATAQERPSVVQTVNRVAYRTQTPWTSVQAHGYDGLVGPTIFPGETACYECLSHRINANLARPEFYEDYRSALESDAAVTDPEPPHPSFLRTLAGIATLDIEHILEYGVGYTAGRLVTMSAIDLSFSADRVMKVPRCDVCGKDIGTETSPLITLQDVKDASNLSDRG